MKVERKEIAPVVQPKCKYSGAVVGDKVMYSSHNPACKSLPRYLKHNTLYEVVEIKDDQAIIETGVLYGGNTTSGFYSGSLDIIVKAPRIEPEQPFQPVVLTLESQQEVDLIAGLTGGVNSSDGISYRDWTELEKVASPNLPKWVATKY